MESPTAGAIGIMPAGWSVHVNGISTANTLKTKNKTTYFLVSWFSDAPYTGTEQNRSNKTHR
jgi:hypothetical protein